MFSLNVNDIKHRRYYHRNFVASHTTNQRIEGAPSLILVYIYIYIHIYNIYIEYICVYISRFSRAK